MSLVTILTDFGTRDPFVGEMKGVMTSVAPEVRTVDLTHEIAPGNVREAAWVLSKAVAWFPSGTCHLAVVDPGVGGDRRAIAAEAGGHRFVGPDNGLLMPAVNALGRAHVREISVREVDRPRRGTTFDGRDRFAPAAARLAAGGRLEEMGPEVHDPVPGAPYAPVRDGEAWTVEIIRADRFGNLVTAAEESFLRRELGEDWRKARVRAAETWIEGVRTAYSDVDPGQPLLSVGGSGVLEISVRDGSAAGALGLRAGDRVRLLPADERSPHD
jgi:hypothetical protein